MRESSSLWKLRGTSLERARRTLSKGDPEGLHDFRVALRRVGATARALGENKVSRRARAIARSLGAHRQLEVDRLLLSRVGRLGLLTPDAVTALAAHWEKLAVRGEKRLGRAADSRAIHRLIRRVTRLARRGRPDAAERIGRARRRFEAPLGRPLEDADDHALHRYRLAVKQARYLAEDLADLGLREWKPRAEQDRALQESFGRWNDLRMFCRRLAASRRDAEERGSVTLAGELEHLLSVLEPTLASVRAAAVAVSRRTARVVPIALRSA